MNKILYFIRFLIRRVYLFFYLLRKHFFRSLFSSTGLFLSMLMVFFILGILRPVKTLVIQKMEGSLPSEIIRVKAPIKRQPVSLMNLFNKKVDLKLGVNRYQLAKIIQMKEIDLVYRSQLLQVPALGELQIFNRYISFDLPVQGVSPALVRPYLTCMRNFRATKIKQGNMNIEQVPLVIPEAYAELATTYAMINGYELDLKGLSGLEFTIYLDRSIVGGKTDGGTLVKGKICGFVPQGIVTAVGSSINWVKEVHEKRNLKNAASSYDQVFARVKNPKDINKVKTTLKKMGLEVPQKRKKYAGIYEMLEKLDYAIWGFAGILLLLTSIAMINSFALLTIEKKYEFGLYLVFGASPLFIWVLMFFEGLFWGGIHSALALYIAEQTFTWLKTETENIPLLGTLAGTGWQQIEFTLQKSEKIYLIIAAMAFAGISSLIPALWMMGRKTLSLVKKD